MSATAVRLTPGAKVALGRLAKGEKLEQERNRSLIQWTGGNRESLHHLTFKNLDECGALKIVKGRPDHTTFAISAKGKKLAES